MTTILELEERKEIYKKIIFLAKEDNQPLTNDLYVGLLLFRVPTPFTTPPPPKLTYYNICQHYLHPS
jgi:hypothetical protein